MKLQISQLVTVLVSLLLLQPTVAIEACFNPSTVPVSRGFNVKFYVYDFFSQTTGIVNIPSLSWDYKKKPIRAITKGVVTPNFKVLAPYGYEPFVGSIYGVKVETKQTLTELSGYFRAPETGTYVFQVVADDIGISWIGAGKAFDCYADSSSVGSDARDNFFIVNFSKTGHVPQKQSVTLQKGFYYPIKFNHVNNGGPSKLEIGFTTPSGRFVQGDWSEFIFQLDNVPPPRDYVYDRAISQRAYLTRETNPYYNYGIRRHGYYNGDVDVIRSYSSQTIDRSYPNYRSQVHSNLVSYNNINPYTGNLLQSRTAPYHLKGQTHSTSHLYTKGQLPYPYLDQAAYINYDAKDSYNDYLFQESFLGEYPEFAGYETIYGFDETILTNPAHHYDPRFFDYGYTPVPEFSDVFW